MLIEVILALFLGIFFGIITGLSPGIHINLVSAIFVSFAAAFSLQPMPAVIFIVAMSITHTFLDFIPSIFLGAPDSDASLSVLPGHKFLLEGKAYDAVIYTAYGSLLAIPIILLFTPLFIFLLPKLFYYIKYSMFFILVSASAYLLIKEKNSRLSALFIFLLSGILGIIVFNFHLSQPLLPLLSGLFGSSSLITSILKKQMIPQQKISSLKSIRLTKKEIANASLASVVATPLCSFLPALGSSQAAVIGSDILGETTQKEFLMLLGSINTIIMGLSFVTLFSLNKTRTGSAAAVSEIIQALSFSNLLLIIAAIILSGTIAFFLTIFFAKIFARIMMKIKYNFLSIIILSILVIMVFIFSGILGFLVFLVSSFTGLLAISMNIRRTHLMGSMMLYTLVLYLPL